MTRLAIIAAASLLLAGCASFSPDGGFGKVSQLTQERTGQGVALQRSPEDAQTAPEPGGRASPDGTDCRRGCGGRALEQPAGCKRSSVTWASLNLKRCALGASKSFFGFWSHEWGVGALKSNGRCCSTSWALTMPMAKEVGQQRFEQAQYQAAYDAVSLAADVRRAYFDAVAAQAGEVLRAGEGDCG